MQMLQLDRNNWERWICGSAVSYILNRKIINQKTVTKSTFMSWHTENPNPLYRTPPLLPAPSGRLMKTFRVRTKRNPGTKFTAFRDRCEPSNEQQQQQQQQFAWLAVTQSTQNDAEARSVKIQISYT